MSLLLSDEFEASGSRASREAHLAYCVATTDRVQRPAAGCGRLYEIRDRHELHCMPESLQFMPELLRLLLSTMDSKRTAGRGPGRPRITDYVTRTGCCLGLPAILIEHGVDPRALLREVGLPPETFDDARNVVPFATLCRYVELATLRTGVPDLGLRACLHTGLRSLVTVGYLVAHSQNVGLALGTLEEYLYLHDNGGVSFVAQEGPSVALGYEILIPDRGGTDQVTFGSLAIAANIMRELCGHGFRIQRVTFAYPPPRDVTLFRKFFRAPVRFSEARSAIVFDARWLDAQISQADSFIRGVLEEKAASEGVEIRDTLEARIQRVVRALVARGRWSADEVASSFGMSRRTLARRLKESGASFRTLLEGALFDAARHLLDSSSLSVREIAAMVGYADPASFSRAFKRWSGLAPRAWRQKRAQG